MILLLYIYHNKYYFIIKRFIKIWNNFLFQIIKISNYYFDIKNYIIRNIYLKIKF